MTMLQLILLSIAVSCSGQQEFFSISWGDGDDGGGEFAHLFDDVAPLARVLSPEPSLSQTQDQQGQQRAPPPPQRAPPTPQRAPPPPQRAPPTQQSAPLPFQQKRLIGFSQQQNSLSQQLDPFPQLDGGSQQRANFFSRSSSEQNFGTVTKVTKPQLFFSRQQNDPFIEPTRRQQQPSQKQQQPSKQQQQLRLNPQEEHELALKQQQQQIAFQQRQHDIAIKKQLDIIASEKKQQDNIISQRGQPTEQNEIFQPLLLHTATSFHQEAPSQTFEEEAIQEIIPHHQQETIFFPKLGSFKTSHTVDASSTPLDSPRSKQRNIPQEENNLGNKSKELKRNLTTEQPKKILEEKSSFLQQQKIGKQLDKATNIRNYEEVTVAMTTELMAQATVTRPPLSARPTQSRPRDDEPLVDTTSQQTSDLPQDLIQDLVENVSLIENLVKSLGELETLANEVLYIQEETSNRNTHNDHFQDRKWEDRKEKIKHRNKYEENQYDEEYTPRRKNIRDRSIDHSSYEVYDEKEEFEDYRRPRRNN